MYVVLTDRRTLHGVIGISILAPLVVIVSLLLVLVLVGHTYQHHIVALDLLAGQLTHLRTGQVRKCCYDGLR